MKVVSPGRKQETSLVLCDLAAIHSDQNSESNKANDKDERHRQT